jgi:hypothetical protein
VAFDRYGRYQTSFHWPVFALASTDFLCLERFAEGGRHGLVFREAVEKVGDVVDEGMLVTDLQAGDPPVAHVGLVAVGDVDAAPAADDRVVAVIEVAQAVQVVQVPGD